MARPATIIDTVGSAPRARTTAQGSTKIHAVRHQPRRAWRRSRTVTAVASTVLAGLLAGAAVGVSGDHTPAPGAAPPTTQAASRTAGPTRSGSTAADAAAHLERVAAGLASGPADPARARYEYVDLRTWESDSAAPPAAPLGTGPGRRIRVWTTGHGHSRTVVIDETRGCPPESDRTGDDLGPFDGPLAADPDAVRRQLLHEPLPAGAVPDVFGQIAFFYSSRFVPLATRQGLLRMLARQPGISLQPDVTDHLGRAGFAVTWTYQPPMPFTVTKTLVFDRRTGQLLTSHSRGHHHPDATTPQDPGDEYENFTVFLTSTYTPDNHTPNPGCT